MDDRTLINDLGGPAKVAELLGYEKEGGTQRVHNWLTRGIPPKVKLQRPDLFLRAIPLEGAPADTKAAARGTTQSDIDPYVCGATARPGAKRVHGDRPDNHREGR